MTEEQSALQATGLRKRFGRGQPWALVDVDLMVPTGSLTALVGPNGAGKSTLIRTWLGFERPTAGSVAVAGVDPMKDRPHAVAHLGYVPQLAVPWRGLTVGDHVARAALLRRGFDQASARDRLERLGIPLERLATRLSGGERAQLILALALGTEAETLLLDEPLASLDPLARRDFLRVLVDAARSEGRTALISSHIVGDLESACDRIVVLAGGRVVLNTAVTDAIASHSLTHAPVVGRRAVGEFADVGGRPAFIWNEPPQDEVEQASLEEIVIGYLARAASEANRR